MRSKWPFWAATAILVIGWLVAQLPRTEYFPRVGCILNCTKYEFGRPLPVATWIRTNGEESSTVHSSFVVSNAFINLIALLGAVGLAWLVTWQPRKRSAAVAGKTG
jgi:hypothetical protein